ncbi:MAG: hypothetical protein ABIK92_21735 [Pseudomonadota bacterium]
MNDAIITGAIVTLGFGIVAKIVWDWLKGRNDPQIHELFNAMKSIDANIESLVCFHNKTNGSGRPLAYFNDECIEKTVELQKDLKALPIVLDNILSELKSLHGTLNSVISVIRNIKN